MFLGGITVKEREQQLEYRDKFYDQFLVYEGEHEVSKEVKRYEETAGQDFSLLGKNAIHRKYVFPNGQGVSVIHASFSWNLWETLVSYETDIERHSYFRDVEKVLMRVMNYEKN